MKTVAVVPVKSTSSRIESKNIKLLSNKPLFLHTLEKLLTIKTIDEVWLDTDDINIINLAYNYGCKGFKYFIRDKKFADNKTDGNKLLENEINNIEADIYIQVLCTSPFTKPETIEKCANILKSGEHQSVVACFKEKFYLWNSNGPIYDKYNIPNSNTLDDTIVESMSLYGITKNEFMNTKMRIGSNPYLLGLEGDEIIDINYIRDFDFAEKVAFYNKFTEQSIFNNLKLKLNTCILADILNELGYSKNILKSFKLNVNNSKVFGRTRPMQIRPLKEGENPNDIYKCLNSYNSVNYGDIIFVNNLIDKKAYFGDLNATISITKSAQATIINGYTRDTNRLIELGYPVFYKNNTCDDVKNYGTLDYFDQSIEVDSVKIYVNDLIFADIDGVVIIPREIEMIVLEKCRKVIENENNIANAIINGNDINFILEKFGAF
jgi:CMP-N-acetylneuraminic acid synthetase/regulator of RNase E activity RraA